MSRSSLPFGVIGFAGVLGAAVLLVTLGPPRDRSAPRAAPTPEPPALTVAGVTLTSASADLPTDDVTLPDGPHRDTVEANCTACHSPAMITAQPPLTRAQWQATVEKMQKVYRAPVDGAAVPGIVAYLTRMSDLQSSPARGGGPSSRSGGGGEGSIERTLQPRTPSVTR